MPRCWWSICRAKRLKVNRHRSSMTSARARKGERKGGAKSTTIVDYANWHALRGGRLHFMGAVSDLLQSAAERLSLGDPVASHCVGIRFSVDGAGRAPTMVMDSQGRSPTEGAERLRRQLGTSVGQLVYLYLVGQPRTCGRCQLGIFHDSAGERGVGIPVVARTPAPGAVGGGGLGRGRSRLAHLASRASTLDRLVAGLLFRHLWPAAKNGGARCAGGLVAGNLFPVSGCVRIPAVAGA